jgi:hypothetical protein
LAVYVHFRSWELASVLKDSMAKFDSAGAKLIAIGVGTPEKARILADRVCGLVLNTVLFVQLCLVLRLHTWLKLNAA